MNLKLRNTLISIGALSLIGVATAGLVVSLQKQKTIKEKEYLTRPQIFSVVYKSLNIIDNAKDTKNVDDKIKDLTSKLNEFRSLWIQFDRPDERDFADFDSRLEPMLTHLQELVDELQGPTAPSSTQDIRDVINDAWELYVNTPDDPINTVIRATLKGLLQKFEEKWAAHGWPEESQFNEIDKNDHNPSVNDNLWHLFDQLKSIIKVMYNPLQLPQ